MISFDIHLVKGHNDSSIYIVTLDFNINLQDSKYIKDKDMDYNLKKQRTI